MAKILDPSVIKRSSSADFKKSTNKGIKLRSKSVDLDRKPEQKKTETETTPIDPSLVDYKKILKNNLDKSQGDLNRVGTASPTSSILKTSSSPRTRKEMMKKHVKFNEENSEKAKTEPSAPNKPVEAAKTDIKISWVMSIQYSNNSMQNMRAIDQFDSGLKNVNDKMVDKFKQLIDQQIKNEKPTPKESQIPQPITEPQGQNIKDERSELEKYIFVFECRQWLAKDSGDKKTERILKVSNILNGL